MRKPQIEGNEKSYYIEKDCIEIWRYEEDFTITKEDLPYLKKAIKLFEKKKINIKSKKGFGRSYGY